jgi:hypothetical protein
VAFHANAARRRAGDRQIRDAIDETTPIIRIFNSMDTSNWVLLAFSGAVAQLAVAAAIDDVIDTVARDVDEGRIGCGQKLMYN